MKAVDSVTDTCTAVEVKRLLELISTISRVLFLLTEISHSFNSRKPVYGFCKTTLRKNILLSDVSHIFVWATLPYYNTLFIQTHMLQNKRRLQRSSFL